MLAIREVGEVPRADPAFASQVLQPIDIAGVDQWAASSIPIKARMKVAPGAASRIRREMLRWLKLRSDADGIGIPYLHIALVPAKNMAGAQSAVQGAAGLRSEA
jgi:moderate conductance mechanosensitive channel